MARVLVVKNAFGDFSLGDRITDPDQIDATLAGDNAGHVLVSDHADLNPAPATSRKASAVAEQAP